MEGGDREVFGKGRMLPRRGQEQLLLHPRMAERTRVLKNLRTWIKIALVKVLIYLKL